LPVVDQLARRLGVRDAVVIGLGAMLGAGVFVVFAPAAAAAGGAGLLAALALAGFVAFCNATSSARLAARYPESGGTYVYGRERLHPFAGFLAGWGFVVGKTASCAAMALTIGAYLWPERARLVAVLAVLAVTAVIGLFDGSRPSDTVTFVGYLITTIAFPPVALYLARMEPTRWGNLILGVACLVLPVLVLRLQQIASVTGG
jgi:APA family basic amino acid/polyamine antiporter